jgi:4'-phosphopantetheinyl transferase
VYFVIFVVRPDLLIKRDDGKLMNSWPQSPAQLPALQDHVHVWAVRLDDASVDLDRAGALISLDERERAARFKFARDRRRYLVAHVALHEILQRYLPIVSAGLSFVIGANGKPSLPQALAPSGVEFNLSHSNEMALLAVCHEREVGVDIEYVKEDFEFQEVAEHFFSAREVAAMRGLPPSLQRQAFFKCWTSKEAFLKAKGTGLSGALDEVEIAIIVNEQVRITANVPGWSLAELDSIDGHEAALVVAGAPAPINYYLWEPGLGFDQAT